MHSNLLKQFFLAIALKACFFCTIQSTGADEESRPDFQQERQNDGWEDLFDGKTMRG